MKAVDIFNACCILLHSIVNLTMSTSSLYYLCLLFVTFSLNSWAKFREAAVLNSGRKNANTSKEIN